MIIKNYYGIIILLELVYFGFGILFKFANSVVYLKIYFPLFNCTLKIIILFEKVYLRHYHWVIQLNKSIKGK